MALTSTIALGTVPAVYAKGVTEQQVIDVNISAGPLERALVDLGDQLGVDIFAASELVRRKMAPSVSGALTADEALRRVLVGSGLEARRNRDGAYLIFQRTSDNEADNTFASGDAGFDEASGEIDTIVVHGEKFSRGVFDTYTSVDVITGDELDSYLSNTISQALNRSANIRSFETGEGNSSFIIRGLNADGVTQPSRSAPVISVIVDGAPQGIETTRRGSRGAWDIEQIEVLRGPQSTLQGRDALGGAVLVQTKDPTWEPEALFEGIAGSNDLLSGAVALSTPLIKDQLAFRVAGQIFRRKNDISYADPALEKLGQDEFEELRGKLLLKPAGLPDFNALLTVSYTHDKPAWGLVNGPDFFARVYDDTGQGAEFRDTKVKRYILDVSYEISSAWKVKSITSYIDTHVKIDTPDGYSNFNRDDTRDYDDFAQDLQLTYDDEKSPFSGVFGLYAGRYEGNSNSVYTTSLLSEYGIAEADIQRADFKTLIKSVSAYTDMRYDIGKHVTVIAGGRMLRDVVSANTDGRVLNQSATLTAIGACLYYGIGCPPAPVYTALDEDSSATSKVFLPKVGLAFHLTEKQSLAATVNRGYRAGFSELQIGTTNLNEVEPEFLWSYELAYRSKWLGDRLQINANAFYNDYVNQQIPVFFDEENYPGLTATINAAESHSYGVEMDVRWVPAASLDLFASAGILKTEFDRGTAIVSDAEVDLEGNEFPEAPAFTASVGGIWRHKSGFFLGGDASYTDGFYSKGALDNLANRQLDDFTVVNLQAGIEFGNITLTAYSKNLFDERYLTSINSAASRASIGEGRTFGIQVNGRF
jgi:outer membrane receptor protein involved in Fe transport